MSYQNTPNNQPAPQYAPPPQTQQPAYNPAPPTNTLAIVALISSFFISVVGVILGHIALNQIKRTGEGGRGLALAGLIIGYVGLAATVLLIIFWLSIIGIAMTSY